jgi:hypothetical protein
MRLLFSIVLASLLFACTGRSGAGKPAANTTTPEFYRLDTAAKPDRLFYPVYQLSPRTTALVVNFSENGQKGLMDSIFDGIIHADSSGSYGPDGKVYDTLGPYQLMQSATLEAAVKKHFDPDLYVYGTKGKIKANIRAVVFGLDECRTNILAFCLDDANLATIGHPIFCSNKNIDLRYSNAYDKMESTLRSYLARTPSDYDDSIPLKVMANAGDFYFTYSDDFAWGQRLKETQCKFPARGIYRIDQNNNVSSYWLEDLDLFGIPCD